MTDPPVRAVRAVYDGRTIRVYQAYSDEIADAALAARTFVAPPFRLGRMTWIKPSFLWMMYRCGWATKDPRQARVLAVDLTRDGFVSALRHACLSHYEAGLPHEPDEHRRLVHEADAVVQWDPERDLHGRPLAFRSLQLGLRGEAVRRYVEDWIVGITDIGQQVRAIKQELDAGRVDAAANLLPPERLFPLPTDIVARLNGSAT